MPSNNILEEGSTLKERRFIEFQKINFKEELELYFTLLTIFYKQLYINSHSISNSTKGLQLKNILSNGTNDMFNLRYSDLEKISRINILEYKITTTSIKEKNSLLSNYFIWIQIQNKFHVSNPL